MTSSDGKNTLFGPLSFSCSRTANVCRISKVNFKFLDLYVLQDASAIGIWSNSKYVFHIDVANLVNEHLYS